MSAKEREDTVLSPAGVERAAKRQARLAEALRQNLRKRTTQRRARTAQSPMTGPASEATGPPPEGDGAE